MAQITNSVGTLATAIALLAGLAHAQLTVDVDGASYSVSVAGKRWLPSSSTWYRNGGTIFSTADGSLKVANQRSISGSDIHGKYTGKTTSYTTDGGPAAMETAVRIYEAAGIAIFTQSFPRGMPGAPPGSSSDNLLSGYPTFVAEDLPDNPRGVLSFQGDMTGSGTRASKWGSSKNEILSAVESNETGECRITTTSTDLHSSGNHFNAWTVASGGSSRQYEEHPGDFCDCTGHDLCNHWAFKSDSYTQAACQAQCDKLNCSCYDFRLHGGGGGGGGGAGAIGTGVSGTGPIAIFNTPNADNTLVLSAHNNFMVANQAVSNSTLEYGLMSSITSIDAGFSLETVVVLSSGINNAMDAWGDILLARSGKQRTAYRRDFATQYLGYSTDNGAYYYYQTEPNKNYEDTLLDVHAYAQQEKIPYKYVLLDSWWYYKGVGGGIDVWDPRPDVFPEGKLGPFYKKTGWLGQLHNRYWSSNTNYSKKNGGKYNFIEADGQKTCPDDQQFWIDLIANKSRGDEKMFMYEQDWLDTEFDGVAWLRENVSAAKIWLTQMDRGCAASNVTIQYCMSHVRHILQSTELMQVTNARASGDYHPGSGQWNIGLTSILAHAVGIAPSKDNYWSTAVQKGTHYGPHTAETHSALQSAVLTLSDGPVCPSDAVGNSNTSLIMHACDASGRLLRPDRPATALDAIIIGQALGDHSAAPGLVWSTHANVSGVKYGYVLVPELASEYSVSTTQLGYGSEDLIAVHHGDVGSPQKFDSTLSLKLSKCDVTTFDIVTVSPRLEGGWALLGEPNKWVSVSSQRFSDVSTSRTSASVVASGPPGEIITVAWLDPEDNTLISTCTIGASGRVTVTASDGKSSCSTALRQ